MKRLCDVCHGVYANNSSFSEHQRKTGHKQIAATDGERTEKVDSTKDLGELQDSLKGKEVNIAQLNDSITVKDELIASLEDSIKTKHAEFATLHDEIAQLSSLEHEQDIVRHTLKSLNKEAYDAIGQQLGFVDVPKPQPATVADSTTQDRAEAARDAHNVEAVRSIPTPDTTAQVEDKEPEIFIGKKEGDGWKYFENLGFSVKE